MIRVKVYSDRIDLFLKREQVAFAWPGGEPMEWERESFPIRCSRAVLALAEEARGLSARQARELIKAKRREILWP